MKWQVTVVNERDEKYPSAQLSYLKSCDGNQGNNAGDKTYLIFLESNKLFALYYIYYPKNLS